jgi:hypothetical protein
MEISLFVRGHPETGQTTPMIERIANRLNVRWTMPLPSRFLEPSMSLLMIAVASGSRDVPPAFANCSADRLCDPVRSTPGGQELPSSARCSPLHHRRSLERSAPILEVMHHDQLLTGSHNGARKSRDHLIQRYPYRPQATYGPKLLGDPGAHL